MSMIIEGVIACSLELLDEGRCKNIQFHCIQHTNDVVKAVNTNATHLKLSSTKVEILTIATYFHDRGLTYVYKGHKYVSASNGMQFLKKQNINILKDS